MNPDEAPAGPTFSTHPLRKTMHEIQANKTRRREIIRVTRVGLHDDGKLKCDGCERPIKGGEKITAIQSPDRHRPTDFHICLDCIMHIWTEMITEQT